MDRNSFLKIWYIVNIVITAVGDVIILFYVCSLGLSAGMIVALIFGLGLTICLQACQIFIIKIIRREQLY